MQEVTIQDPVGRRSISICATNHAGSRADRAVPFDTRLTRGARLTPAKQMLTCWPADADQVADLAAHSNTSRSWVTRKSVRSGRTLAVQKGDIAALLVNGTGAEGACGNVDNFGVRCCKPTFLPRASIPPLS